MSVTSAASNGEIFLFSRSFTVPPYEVVRSKRRTIALVINAEARLIVRAPVKTSDIFIKRLVREKQNWILAKQEEQRIKISRVPVPELIPGEKIFFMGGMLDLPRVADASGLRDWYRTQARKVISERTAKFAAEAGIGYTRIRITDAQKRWGSCSAKGSLSFAWRLILAPPDVIDYVIVHELMHLRVMDHSKKYWREVAGIFPQHKIQKKWLRENSHLLNYLTDLKYK